MQTQRPPMSLDEVRYKAPSVFATQAHGGVSDDYRFIPTVDMANTLMRQGWQIVQAGEHKVRNASKAGFQKHMLRFRNPSLPTVNGSEVDLVVLNSHDRTSAFRFLAGIYRQVCANGMIAGDNLFAPISVKHIGYSADNVVDAAFKVVESVPVIADRLQLMSGIALTEGEQKALASAAIVLKYGAPTEEKKLPLSVVGALKPRRSEDAQRDLYTTINVLQENLVRGGQRDSALPRGQRRLTRPVGSISENIKLNQGLWTLAEEMLKLKQA